jgi:hypothetical protein
MEQILEGKGERGAKNKVLAAEIGQIPLDNMRFLHGLGEGELAAIKLSYYLHLYTTTLAFPN